MRSICRFVVFSSIPIIPGIAQPMHHHDMMTPAEMHLMSLASGTSMNPESWTMPMLMGRAKQWRLMFMSRVFVIDTQQSGPRGGDKFYSTNWGMASAMRSFGQGALSFDTMLSLEPATVTDRRYPELFQTGETAYGRPIIDGQHPHNFVMSLGVHYARRVGEGGIAELYYAPVGDPALGPVAYPHRASAAELAQAPLGHHWQDSTHISTNVVTGAVKYQKVRLEVSGFSGIEPGENRWTIAWKTIDSYSGRFSVFPTRNWMVQVSSGRLVNETRTTASAHYTRDNWSTSWIWGRDHGHNSFLAETVFPVKRANWITGRWELVDKDELAEPGVHRIVAYTGGYTRDFDVFRYVATGLGFNFTGYNVARGLQASYGEHPVSASVFLRLRLQRPTH